MRECGLKWRYGDRLVADSCVTPLAGVWIEIIRLAVNCVYLTVTPLAGVWIEIYF